MVDVQSIAAGESQKHGTFKALRDTGIKNAFMDYFPSAEKLCIMNEIKMLSDAITNLRTMIGQPDLKNKRG